MQNHTLAPETIMKIQKCGDLFSRDSLTRKKEYHMLMMKYKEADKIGQHINMLYQRASEISAQGQWEATGTVFYQTTDRKQVTFRYRSSYTTELGATHISDRHLLLQIKPRFATQMTRQLSAIRYANTEMKREFQPALPRITAQYNTAEGCLLVVEKQTDEFSLADIQKAFGHVPQKQTAWIISRLLNLCCFFQYNEIVHNGIHISNVFISPQRHQLMLYGGWGYCTSIGEKLLGIQRDIYSIMPLKAKSDKTGDPLTDLECVKVLGQQLLGEELKHTPKPFYDFLENGSSPCAAEEFQKWDTALTLAYGPRKYIPWSITAGEIYSEK